MKTLLVILLVANVAFFAWTLYGEKSPEANVVLVDEATIGPRLDISATAEISNALAGADQNADGDATMESRASCISIGPFADSAEAEGIVRQYLQAGMYSQARSTDGQLFIGHWVQIRDIDSRETANAMLERLHASELADLADAYLLPTDDEGLRISLGLFGDMQRAERVEQQAESLGLPAEILPRMRDAIVFFVDITLPPGRSAGPMVRRFGEERVLRADEATCPAGP